MEYPTEKKSPIVLETTLRDGSYAINFSFTTSDTATICTKLEEAGFRYIEIGHGMGLNASNAGNGKYGRASATDEQYMIAAKESLTKAKYGMFCIPGIARLENLYLAGKHGMGFIRIGTNVDRVADSESFIKRSKEIGMFVAANYMKSYAMAPDKFAQQVLKSEEWGVDMVYIVDSAGGMFPEDIKSYYDAIRKVSSIRLGFHGHNNLSSAVFNSIAAADMGIEFIDSSLQGLGRSSGNACTEILIAALQKRGYDMKLNFLKTLQIGHDFIQPLIRTKGYARLDIVAGFADFHSSYMPLIREFSDKHKIPPEVLIIELCKVNKVECNKDILTGIVERLQSEENIFLGGYEFNRYTGGEQEYNGED